MVRYIDPTLNLPVPAVPKKPNAYLIGYLRSGKKEVMKLILLDLTERGYLQIKEAPKWPYNKQWIAQATDPPSLNDLSDLERYVFNYFAISSEPNRILKSIPSSVEEICEKFQHELENEKMLPSSNYSFVGILAGAVGISVIAGLGSYKLMAALEKGRSNVGFLILLCVFSLMSLIFICKQPRITQLGRRYIDQLQHAFKKLKKEDNVSDSGKTELLLMGVFGVTVLAGSQFPSIGNLFHQATSCSGGCSSSCSGSGCNGCGGGGCGGGCGGCGG